MGKTTRKYADWVDWSGDFEKKLARGHVSRPIGDTDGNKFVEIWDQLGKKRVKKWRAKKNRQKGKLYDED